MEKFMNIVVWFMLITWHIIPAIIAMYFIIKRKSWFSILPTMLFCALPIVGALVSYLIIESKGEFFNLEEDLPLFVKIIFLLPPNLVIICVIYLLIIG